MTARKHAADAGQAVNEPPTDQGPRDEATGVFGGAALLRLLYRRASQNLNESDLRWLAIDGAAYAEQTARNAAALAEGVGCLVSSDGDAIAARSSASAGCFQSASDVPALLFHFAAVFEQLEGLTNVTAEAYGDLLLVLRK